MDVAIYEKCANCLSCKDSSYQTPPVLCTGNEDSDLMVIAQNPGEIKGTTWRNLLAAEMIKAPQSECCGALMKSLYRLDFESSHGCEVLTEVFGNMWLDEWLYTNAVRCRTKNNKSPSVEMVGACNTWTRILLQQRKVRCIVFIGVMAASQYLGENIKYVQNCVPRRHPKTRAVLLALPHYVKWSASDISDYARIIIRMKETK